MGSRFLRITIRDLVATEARFADLLGIRQRAAVLGGLMGDQDAHPGMGGRVARAGRPGPPAGAAADKQIGWAATQLHAIRTDPNWHGGDYHDRSVQPVADLGIVRRIAHLTYRSEPELAARFGRAPQDAQNRLASGRFTVESYSDHHADTLAAGSTPAAMSC